MTETILIVDDEQSICEALRKVLLAEKYYVLLAESGQQAIELLRNQPLDLLLLDLNLPNRTGWGILEWLAEANPLLPVVLITGKSNQRELAQKSGASALMEKPLDVPVLLRTIRELLDEPVESRQERAARRACFKFLPADDQLLRQMLTERFTSPFSLPKPNHAWRINSKPSP